MAAVPAGLVAIVQSVEANTATLAEVQGTLVDHTALLGAHTVALEAVQHTQGVHTQTLAGMQATLGVMQQTLAAIQALLGVGGPGAIEIRRRVARAANASGVGGPLLPLPDDAGNIPAGWPAGFTVHMLTFGLVGPVDALLEQYGIADEVAGADHFVRRSRLAQFLGVRLA